MLILMIALGVVLGLGLWHLVQIPEILAIVIKSIVGIVKIGAVLLAIVLVWIGISNFVSDNPDLIRVLFELIVPCLMVWWLYYAIKKRSIANIIFSILFLIESIGFLWFYKWSFFVCMDLTFLVGIYYFVKKSETEDQNSRKHGVQYEQEKNV